MYASLSAALPTALITTRRYVDIHVRLQAQLNAKTKGAVKGEEVIRNYLDIMVVS
ncbi:MAG TPA: hypothetical protein VHN12_04255 [Geobacteraceae bacterium]|nr:hypothetical protein [Geobacteraceae bacterium]